MTNHVPTLKTCQNLKEAGFPIGTAHYWVYHNINSSAGVGWELKPYWDALPITNDSLIDDYVVAPLLTEILEQLPGATKEIPVSVSIDKVEDGYEATDERFQDSPLWTESLNPVEAAARLWLVLNTNV